MKRLTSLFIVGLCMTLLGAVFATQATAQSSRNETSLLNLTEQLDVGGRILEPGTYRLRIVRARQNRNLLQVWNADETKLFATLLTVPHQEGPAGKQVPNSRYVYYPESADNIKTLRTWFAANTPGSGGHDIVYPRKRALELAALTDEPVVATEDEVQMAELETAPLVVVTPAEETQPYKPITTVKEPPTRVARSSPLPDTLPQTASNLPLYLGLGLLSLLLALGLRTFARRIA